MQLNNRFNTLAVNDSVDEAENVLSQGANSPFANLPSTNLLSTPYPNTDNNSMASRTRVANNSIKGDTETVVSDAKLALVIT